MGKGLSKQQKVILKVADSFPGGSCEYWSEFIPKVKFALYPGIWTEKGSIKTYGRLKTEKNSARAIISKAISRLKKRGLLEFINPQGHPGTGRIFLSDLGKITANEVPK